MSVWLYLETKRLGFIYEANITYNLREMANALGIEDIIFDDSKKYKAKQIIRRINSAIMELENSKEYYIKFNPKNGFGTLDFLLILLKEFLSYCIEYPSATVIISG